jgi:hypothetical protein
MFESQQRGSRCRGRPVVEWAGPGQPLWLRDASPVARPRHGCCCYSIPIVHTGVLITLQPATGAAQDWMAPDCKRRKRWCILVSKDHPLVPPVVLAWDASARARSQFWPLSDSRAVEIQLGAFPLPRVFLGVSLRCVWHSDLGKYFQPQMLLWFMTLCIARTLSWV